MSAEKPDLKLGAEREWGRTSCDYGLEGPACDLPATTHIMWLHDRHTSGACDEHLAFLDTRRCPEYETHPFEGNCGMPGTLWHHPYEDEEHGYCLFPAVDDASVVVEEPEPAGVLR